MIHELVSMHHEEFNENAHCHLRLVLGRLHQARESGRSFGIWVISIWFCPSVILGTMVTLGTVLGTFSLVCQVPCDLKARYISW